MNVKLLLEYVGSDFHGWQIQPGLTTVEGELTKALDIYLSSLAKSCSLPSPEFVSIMGSGRTDSGVHALGQVASFTWPLNLPFEKDRLLSALNGMTPRGLVILDLFEVSDQFNARRTPHYKCYSYNFLLRSSGLGQKKNRAWLVPPFINIEAMIQASRYFKGEHDFSSFRARNCTAKTTNRILFLSECARADRDNLVYIVYGNGFLKQMIRIIAGTLLDVGLGKYPPEEVREILKARDRLLAGQTAPACGLCLEWVRYL